MFSLTKPQRLHYRFYGEFLWGETSGFGDIENDRAYRQGAISKYALGDDRLA